MDVEWLLWRFIEAHGLKHVSFLVLKFKRVLILFFFP